MVRPPVSESGVVKWLYYLKNIQNMSEQDLKNEEEPVFRKLLVECKYSNLNNMEQEEYWKSLLEYEGIRDAIECAREDAAKDNFEQGLQQGLKQGREEGETKGRAEGLNEGLAKGEAKAKLAMAKNMLEKGIDRETIISITGLTTEVILSNR